MTVNTERYLEFVNGVTSQQSKDHELLYTVYKNLRVKDFLPNDLLTSVGMCVRIGEFTEVVKKIVFQGKPVTEENLFHLKRELGDIMWYVASSCMGLDTTIDDYR